MSKSKKKQKTPIHDKLTSYLLIKQILQNVLRVVFPRMADNIELITIEPEFILKYGLSIDLYLECADYFIHHASLDQSFKQRSPKGEGRYICKPNSTYAYLSLEDYEFIFCQHYLNHYRVIHEIKPFSQIRNISDVIRQINTYENLLRKHHPSFPVNFFIYDLKKANDYNSGTKVKPKGRSNINMPTEKMTIQKVLVTNQECKEEWKVLLKTANISYINLNNFIETPIIDDSNTETKKKMEGKKEKRKNSTKNKPTNLSSFFNKN